MIKKNFFLLAALLLFFISNAQKTDKKLNEKLQEAINGFNGDIGIYVKNLRTGKTHGRLYRAMHDDQPQRPAHRRAHGGVHRGQIAVRDSGVGKGF